MKMPVHFENARLPVSYRAARTALRECDRLDECKNWGDKAEALATYARLSHDPEMELVARRIRLRAIARAGELLLKIPDNQRGVHLAGGGAGSQPNPQSRRGMGRAAGMRVLDVTQALAIARVPVDVRELLIESPNPPPPSRLQNHPSRIRPPRDVRADRFRPGPHYREVFIHGGGLTGFASFLKRHPPAEYFPFLSSDERRRASIYLGRIESWCAEARRKLVGVA